MSSLWDTFSYQPFSKSSYDEVSSSPFRFEIRLIYLHPGGFDDRIYCTIYHANIREEQPQTEYTALSYVWGDATQTKTIQLGYHQPLTSEDARTWPSTPSSGVECYKPFQVTTNLEKALRHLRDRTSERILWVDAICINQSDSEEKHLQIQSMRKVYSNAVEVRIWLGSLGDVQEAIKSDQSRPHPKLEGLYSDLHKGEDARVIISCERVAIERALLAAKTYVTSGNCLLSQETNGNRVPDELQALGIRIILMQRWWRRVWVIQEATLSKKDPVMQCGDMQIGYRKFLEAAMRYTSRDASSRPIQSYINLVVHGLFHDGYERSGISLKSRRRLLTYLSCMSGNFEVSDPKDRILGIRGLLPVLENMSCSFFLSVMRANRWGQKDHEFFQIFAVWILHNDKPQSYPLRILESGPSNIEGVPSWVPMWRSRKWSGEDKTHGAPESKYEMLAQGVSTEDPFDIYGRCTGIRIHDALALGRVITTLQLVPPQKRRNTDVLRGAIMGVEERILAALRLIPHADAKTPIQKFREYLRINFWDVDGREGPCSSEYSVILEEFLGCKRKSKKRKGQRRSSKVSADQADPKVPSPSSIAKLSTFFEHSRDLVVGSKIVGHIFEDEDSPPCWQSGDRLYLIPECRWVLGLRRSGSGYRYMYRVFISDLEWQHRKQMFDDQGTYEDIVLI